MSDAFIAREAAHARAMCRTALRQQVDAARRDLGLPSLAQERHQRMTRAIKQLSEAMAALGEQARAAAAGFTKALAAVPKQEDYTHGA